MRRLAAYVALSAILCLLLTHLWRTPASAQAACDLLTASKSGEATFRIATVAPVPCIFVSDGSVVEGNSEAAVEFRVYTTLPRDFSYFVDYSTAGLTATPGVDFVAVSGTVALSVSTPSVVISVPVIGDLAFEPDEILQLNLTAAGEGFRIEDGQGIGTIVNDDPAPPPAPAPAPAPAPEAVPVPEPQPAPEPPAPPVFTVPTPAAPAPGAPPAPAPSLMPAPNPPAATGPGQTVSVRAFGGGTQSPPGGAIALSARGFASCAEVLFFLDGVRIASAVPAPEGDASIDPVSVPGDAEPGRHTVLARCDGPGFGAPRARLTVTSPPVHRTALVTSLPQPWEVPVDAVSIGISLLAALGMIVLVAVPAELFNSTLEEHNAEIRARLRLPPQRAQPRQPLSPVATFTLFVFVGGFLYALLSPGFGPDASSFALVAGMTIALAVTTAGFGIPQGVYMRRRFGERGRLSVVPATLVVSAIFVVLSLAVRLNPGLIYGVVAGFAFRNSLARDEEGRLAAGTTFCLLLVCLAAWLARGAISDLAARPDAGFMILMLEAALAGIVLVGLESLTIGLIPLRALNGRKIAEWSFAAWIGVFTVTAAAFVHILLTPSSGYVSPLQGRSGFIFVLLAGLLAAGAVAFWAYFQFRKPRPAQP